MAAARLTPDASFEVVRNSLVEEMFVDFLIAKTHRPEVAHTSQ